MVKRNLLIEGWVSYAHSYALVNIYQIISLLRSDDINVYFLEVEPYKESWEKINIVDTIITRQEYNLLQEKMIIYDKEKHSDIIDVIYRISYNYDISSSGIYKSNGNIVPIILFYTSEFQVFDNTNFSTSVDDFITKCFDKKLLPITPSNWSAEALRQFKFDPLVISHGTDVSKYFPMSLQERLDLRKEFEIPKDAFVFLHIGACTSNKNVKGIIKAFYNLSLINDREIYLILKGIEQLYQCQEKIQLYVRELIKEGVINKQIWKDISKKMLYMMDVFTFNEMNELFNVSNCYVSPYLSEGFNLPVLDAMASGIPSIISRGGPTDDFTNEHTSKYPVTVKMVTKSFEKLLVVDDKSLLNEMSSMIQDTEFCKNVRIYGPNHVKKNYTWKKITDKLLNFINYI